ncbi:methionyl-tRNA formyltransferase [Candidatus Omnitrophota bacterium]
MNIVFFGSTEYSVEILKELIAAGCAPLVVTQPDRPKGRGLKVASTEVKAFALKHKLEVVTPSKIRDAEFISFLKARVPDLFVVVSYGKILPKAVLDIPAIIPLGIHPSLLPKYRGAAPINWALINGETRTGVMLFKLTPGIDDGPLVARADLAIDREDDFVSLSEKIYAVSRTLIKKTLPLIAARRFPLKEQAACGMTLAPKIDKQTAQIDWRKDAVQITNLIRGLIPAPCAWSMFRGKRVKFWKACAVDELRTTAEPGEIVVVSRQEMTLKARKGLVSVIALQPEGKNKMSIPAFINGYHPKQGEKFS